MRTTPIVVGFALFAFGGPCIAAGPQSIAGVWRFESDVNQRGDGSLVKFGPALGYEGMVIFTADGFVSGTEMPRGRKWTIGSASLDELRETIGMGTANTGSYTVNPTTQTLQIKILADIDPEYVGKTLTRHYSITGDVLSLSGTWAYQGETLTFTVKYRRIK